MCTAHFSSAVSLKLRKGLVLTDEIGLLGHMIGLIAFEVVPKLTDAIAGLNTTVKLTKRETFLAYF